VRTKAGLICSNLPILPPPVTAKQRVVMIPGNQHEEWTDGYGEKDVCVRDYYNLCVVCVIMDKTLVV